MVRSVCGFLSCWVVSSPERSASCAPGNDDIPVHVIRRHAQAVRTDQGEPFGGRGYRLHRHRCAACHRAAQHPHGAGDGHGVGVRAGGHLLREQAGQTRHCHGGPYGERAYAGVFAGVGAGHGHHGGGGAAYGREGSHRCGACGHAGRVGDHCARGADRDPRHPVCPRDPRADGRRGRCAGRRAQVHAHHARWQRDHPAAVRHQRHLSRCGRCGHGHALAHARQRREHRAVSAVDPRRGGLERFWHHGCRHGHHHRTRHGRVLSGVPPFRWPGATR